MTAYIVNPIYITAVERGQSQGVLLTAGGPMQRVVEKGINWPRARLSEKMGRNMDREVEDWPRTVQRRNRTRRGLRSEDGTETRSERGERVAEGRKRAER